MPQIYSSLRAIFTSFFPGFQPIDGGQLGQFADTQLSASGPNPITALAGGASAIASPLLASAINRVDVVAADNDSVVLPPAVPGQKIFVDNDGAHTLKIFADTQNPNNPDAHGAAQADLIVPNASLTAAAAASVTQATTVPAIYICSTRGYWKQLLCV